MEFFDVDPELALRCAADQVPTPASFNTRISRDDEMLLHALRGYGGDLGRAFVTYLLQGKQMMAEVRQIADWAFGGWAGVSTFLDFACGYGRFTRHLVQEMEPGRVWASDIYDGAVRFQREQFRVNAVPSSARPEDFSLPRTCDLIFVSSLFSHLPRRTFHLWLEALYSLLSGRGLLIFTTHGIEFSGGRAREREREREREFVFRPQSESRTLDVNDYGMTFVSENFVAQAIRDVAGDRTPWRCVRHGHLGFQDLYLMCRDSSADLSRLSYNVGSYGHVGGCWMAKDGSLRLRGWAADLGDEQRVRISIFADDRLLHECSPDHERPDVARFLGSASALHSGWSCSVPAARIAPRAWIAVRISNQDGPDHTISLAKLETMLEWFALAEGKLAPRAF